MKEYFDSKGALVTGAGSGIGLATARAFAEAGAAVALADVDGNAVRLDEMRLRFADETTADARRAQREVMAGIQLDFRQGLAGILSPEQLAEWDVLVEELLGQVHLRHAPRVAVTH